MTQLISANLRGYFGGVTPKRKIILPTPAELKCGAFPCKIEGFYDKDFM